MTLRAKQTIIYLSSLLIIGLTIPSNEPRLLGGADGAGTSPFVIMVDKAGIPGFPRKFCLRRILVFLYRC